MSYPGAKSQAGVWQRIIGQMPPHSVYVETCAGSAEIFFRKERAANSILIDASPVVARKLHAKVGDDAGVKVLHGDALKELANLSAWLPPDAVVYCDPPYMLATRQGRLYYDYEMSDQQHATLLALLQGMKCRVLLSAYPHPLYSSQLQGWRCLDYDTMTRGGKRRECLWCNFPEPSSLHDWRFAGFNYRQRFGMKRFVARWLARIEAMPPRRAGYVWHELERAIAQRQGRSGRPADPSTPPLVMIHGPTAENATRGVTRGVRDGTRLAAFCPGGEPGRVANAVSGD